MIVRENQDSRLSLLHSSAAKGVESGANNELGR